MKSIFPYSTSSKPLTKTAQQVIQPIPRAPASPKGDSATVLAETAATFIDDDMLHQLDKSLGWARQAAQSEARFVQSANYLNQAIELLKKARIGLGNKSGT